MKRALILALAVLGGARPAGAGSREVELGLEGFVYWTSVTPLNLDNLLGLHPEEGLLRGVLNWRESHGGARLVLRGFVERRLGHDPGTAWRAREAYGQYAWGEAFSLRVGKQRVAWGSGFAWNPTNRVERPKNPLNTGLEQEGALAVRADWVPVSWAGVIIIAARSDTAVGDLPFAIAKVERRTAALRARFLVEDTDLAVVVSGGENQRTLVGLDLARHFPAGISAHAEVAAYRGAELPPAREGRTFFRMAAGALRTFGQHSSVAIEYFFNEEGYDDAEAAAYLAGLGDSYAKAVDARQSAQTREAALAAYLAAAGAPYGAGLGLRRHYLHATWTRSALGGRWTAAASGVVGLSDGGLALTPGIAFAPRGDLTLALDGVLPLGPKDSEYRLAPLTGTVQARLKFFF